MAELQRIESVIEWSGLSANAFAKRIGYKSGGSIYNKKDGSRSINLKLITKIANEFPQISKDWLLTGNGSMLLEYKTDRPDQIIEEPSNLIINNKTFDTMTLDALNRMLTIIEKQQDDIHAANMNVRMAMENQANLIRLIPGGVAEKKVI